MLRCHKTLAAHWGIIYKEGKEYTHDPVKYHEYSLITDSEKYFEKIKLISGSITQIRAGHSKEDLPSLIPGYIHYEEVQELYTLKVELPMIAIHGDDGGGNSYCILTKEELTSKYGSCKFNSTVRFLEDNFHTKGDIRDQLLGNLLD